MGFVVWRLPNRSLVREGSPEALAVCVCVYTCVQWCHPVTASPNSGVPQLSRPRPMAYVQGLGGSSRQGWKKGLKDVPSAKGMGDGAAHPTPAPIPEWTSLYPQSLP